MKLNPHPCWSGIFSIPAFITFSSLNISEAKKSLDPYLALRPNLKTRDDYRRIFIPNSSLANLIIEGLMMMGWEPEG